MCVSYPLNSPLFMLHELFLRTILRPLLAREKNTILVHQSGCFIFSHLESHRRIPTRRFLTEAGEDSIVLLLSLIPHQANIWGGWGIDSVLRPDVVVEWTTVAAASGNDYFILHNNHRRIRKNILVGMRIVLFVVVAIAFSIIVDANNNLRWNNMHQYTVVYKIGPIATNNTG